MEGQQKEDVSLTPLGIPMLAGPGAMSTVMVLSAQARTSMFKMVIFVAITVTMLISWAMLRIADRLFAQLGESGIRVATRVMGLVLAAVAVQFVMSGLSDAGIVYALAPAPIVRP